MIPVDGAAEHGLAPGLGNGSRSVSEPVEATSVAAPAHGDEADSLMESLILAQDER